MGGLTEPDWARLGPSYEARWHQLQSELEQEERRQVIEDLRFVREMKRQIERDAALNDIEPVGLEVCDEMIELLTERLL